MAKGRAFTKYLETAPLHNVYSGTTPSLNFLYETSTTRNPQFNIGDRIVLGDGREFRYGKSYNALSATRGCEIYVLGVNNYSLLGATTAVGGTTVTAAAVTHDELAEDELRGGFALIYGSDGDDTDTQFRGIIGNDASASAAAFTIYLDAGLVKEVTTANYCEIFQNPFAALRLSTTTVTDFPKAGVPVAEVSAGSMYFWVQVRGPIWLPPQSGLIDEQIGAMWRHDGSLGDINTTLGVSCIAEAMTQYAGHRLIGSYSGNGPLFNLQG